MKKLFKIIAVVFVALVVIGYLLPEPNKDKVASTALAPVPSEEASPADTDPNETTRDASLVGQPEVEILKSSESVDEYHREIHVKVRNNTDHLISFVALKGVYYDKKNDIVGTGNGNAMNLAAGATKTIDVISVGIENAHHYEVELDNVVRDM